MQDLKNKSSLRIAHISDLHFSKFTFSPMQFFSKRFLGNANLLFSRGRRFKPHKLVGFADFLVDTRVDLVVISGDFSTTAQEIEFGMALDFIEEITARKIHVLTIPGNHDHYTKKAFKNKAFYEYFENDALDSPFPFQLKRHGVEVKQIGKEIYWIGLDTTLATPLFSSFGVFPESAQKTLEQILQNLPEKACIIMTNHYPPLPIKNKPQHSLLRSFALCDLLKKHPNVKLYLHGHCHKHSLQDFREMNLPITLDSGSISHTQKSNFSLIDVSPSHITIRKMKTDKLVPNCQWDVEKREDFLITTADSSEPIA